MKLEYIKQEKKGPVAIITIDKPPVNALNTEAYLELYRAFHLLSMDKEVRAVVLTAKGRKAFVAGADINEFSSLDSASGKYYTEHNNQVREFIRTFPKPVICAINGLAYGGGLVLALMCDVRIACEEVKVNLAEINMGIIGGTQILARIAHSGLARKMVYTGLPLTAKEAMNAGLIDEIVSADNLIPRAMELAELIAQKPPLAIQLAKECLVMADSVELENCANIEKEAVLKLWDTQDKNEAVEAFLNKRPPKFKGV